MYSYRNGISRNGNITYTVHTLVVSNVYIVCANSANINVKSNPVNG